MKMHEVADYVYLPGWHQPFTVGELEVNKDAWNALTPDLQAIVEMSHYQALIYSLSKSEYDNAKALKDFEEFGVQIKEFPDDVMAALKEATETVLQEEAAKDPWFDRIITSYNTFMDGYITWHKMSEKLQYPD